MTERWWKDGWKMVEIWREDGGKMAERWRKYAETDFFQLVWQAARDSCS
jgi:hypothetical protein